MKKRVRDAAYRAMRRLWHDRLKDFTCRLLIRDYVLDISAFLGVVGTLSRPSTRGVSFSAMSFCSWCTVRLPSIRHASRLLKRTMHNPGSRKASEDIGRKVVSVQI